MTYDFEERTSNIEEFTDKTIEVTSAKVKAGDNMTITEMTLKDGTIVSTTSGVIAKQVTQLLEDGNIPFRAKIEYTKAQKGKYSYYTLSKPE